MRREGYELQVSQPQVIFHEKDGVKEEPYEELVIDVPVESSGVVMEKLGRRKAMITDMSEKWHQSYQSRNPNSWTSRIPWRIRC